MPETSGHFSADTKEKIVIAEYSVPRTILWLVICGVIMTTFFSGTWSSSGISGVIDHSPLLRMFIGVGGCIITLGIFVMLLRALLIDRVAVYVRHREVFIAWAYGYQRIRFDQIAAISTRSFPALAAVQRVKGLPTYLPVGFVKESRDKMVTDLEKAIGLD